MLSRKCIKSPSEKAWLKNVRQVSQDGFTSPLSYHCWSNPSKVKGSCKTRTCPKPNKKVLKRRGSKTLVEFYLLIPFLTIADPIFHTLKVHVKRGHIQNQIKKVFFFSKFRQKAWVENVGPSLQMVLPVPFLTIADLIFQMLKCFFLLKHIWLLHVLCC